MIKNQKLLFILSLIFIILNLNILKVNAQNYTIESANFDIELLANGDINVTETWDIDFDGEYTRFYKSLMPNNLENFEEYSDITINWAKINGIECTFDGDLNNRKNYKVNIDHQSHYIMLSWLYKVKNDNVKYQINYTIKDLIKLSEFEDNKVCITVFRPICKDFEKLIKNFNINFKGPNKSNIINFDSNKEVSFNKSENDINLKINNNSGLVKIIIISNYKGFYSDLKYIEYSNPLNETLIFNSSLNIILIFVFCFIVALIIFSTQSCHEINYERNYNYIQDCMDYIKQYGDSALLAVSLTDISGKNNRFIITATIKDFMNRNILIPGVNGIDFNEDVINSLSPKEIEIINGFKKHLSLIERTYREIYEVNLLCYEYLKVLKSELIQKLDKKELKELKKKVNYINWYTNTHYRMDTPISLTNNLYETISYEDITFWSFIKNTIIIKSYLALNEGTTWYNIIDNKVNYNTIYYTTTEELNRKKVNTSSSSIFDSSSSCNSCSSCSSCGGCGGAD